MQRFCNLLERIIEKYPQLAEAKADAFMKALADKYEDQVDHSTALRGKVDRAEIEYAIEFFKRFQNSIEPAEDRDITKWTVQELLQFLKSKPGYKPPTEDEEKEDEQAPPIAYENDGLTVYDGSNEDRCVMIGKGERWCITKGSFANYRYDAAKKFPTFYLVKDHRKDENGKRITPDSSPKSFFVIMVGNDGTYKASDRTNNDLGASRGQSEWDKWESWAFVEQHFPAVQGLESHFKYRPIPESEMDERGMHTLEDWYYLKGVDKKNQRLINALRQDSRYPFQTAKGQSVPWDKFIRTVLTRPEFKPVADLFVKSTYENPEVFLQNYDLFTPAQQKSIIANTNNPQHPVGMTADDLVEQYDSDQISYNTVVDLLKANKIKPTSKTHLYLTGRDNIVYVQITNDIKVYVADKGGMDQKRLTPKTEHYLLDDPYLGDINLQALAKTVEENKLTPSVIQKATAQESESRDVVKVGDTAYILQYGDDSISIVNASGAKTSGQTPKEVVDKLASGIKSNPSKRSSFIKSIIVNKAPAMTAADYTAILDSLSPEERTLQQGADKNIYLSGQPAGVLLYQSNRDPNNLRLSMDEKGYGRDNKGPHSYNADPPPDQIVAATKDALENFIPPITTQGTVAFFRNLRWGQISSSVITNLQYLKLTPDNDYTLVKKEDSVWIVNKTNKDDCKKYNMSSGNVINLRLSQANYDQVVGRQAQPRTQASAAATPNAAAALPANSAGGNVNLQQVCTDNGLSWTSLTTGVQNRLRQGGTVKNIRADRGTDTRNDLLRGRGRITSAYQLAGTASALYIATLNSGAVVGIIAMQPGNVHGVVTGTQFRQYRSAGDLPTIMQNNNINENDIMANKNYLLRKLLERAIKEASPAVAPSEPTTKPKPREKPAEPDPFEIDKDQEVDKKPKAETGKAAEIGKKIINRFKSI